MVQPLAASIHWRWAPRPAVIIISLLCSGTLCCTRRAHFLSRLYTDWYDVIVKFHLLPHSIFHLLPTLYFSYPVFYCCLDIICTSGFAFNFEGGQPVNHVVHMLNCIGSTTFGPLLTCLIKTRSPISHILIFFSHEFRLVISPFLVLGIFKASKTIGYVHQEQMEQQC